MPVCLIASLIALCPPATHLTTEYLENPVGVEAERPRLSWWLDPDAGKQLAYRIEAEGLWDSGWVESADALNIRYGGKYPGDLKRVVWRVKTRTDRGESDWSERAFWVTGLKSWKAKWIGAAETMEKAPPERFVVKVTPKPRWELKVNGKSVRHQTGRDYMFDATRPVYADLTPFLDGSGRDVIEATHGAT